MLSAVDDFKGFSRSLISYLVFTALVLFTYPIAMHALRTFFPWDPYCGVTAIERASSFLFFFVLQLKYVINYSF